MSTKVAILLGTYNGAAYLQQQLNSFNEQTHPDWHIYASDDGSTDGTLDLLHIYQDENPGRLTIFEGPRRGFAVNFLSLVNRPEITADYYAYADQDDVWLPEKLAAAITVMQSLPVGPALYCARSAYVDLELNHIGDAALPKRQLSFKNALVQSLSTGNTMLFNQAACDLLRLAGTQIASASHDWLTYLLVTSVGGSVYFDPQSYIYYRQHGANVIGSGAGFGARQKAIKRLFNNRFQSWLIAHDQILQQMFKNLTFDNQQTFAAFQNRRHQRIWARLKAVRASGVYRQTPLGTFGLYIGAAFNKL